MMPQDNVYGDWPASGEIDIAESRGNNGDDYPTGGRDSLISAMVSIFVFVFTCFSRFLALGTSIYRRCLLQD